MINTAITDSDPFLDLPVSAQLLYFHLDTHGDDDGFIGNPRAIMRMIGVHDDDLKLLIAKQLLLPFESGVVVIKDWLIHNTIRKDRYKPTKYQEEFKRLAVATNGSYTFNTPIDVIDDTTAKPVVEAFADDDNQLATNGKPSDNQRLPQVKLSKVNKDIEHLTSKLADDFEKLWSMYPRKEGKKPALAAYKRSIKAGADNHTIAVGIAAYKRSVASAEKRFIKQGSTFFNQEIWRDFAEMAQVKRDAKPKFDADDWIVNTYVTRGSVDEVLSAIEDEGVPVEPKRVHMVVADYESRLKGDVSDRI